MVRFLYILLYCLQNKKSNHMEILMLPKTKPENQLII